MNISEQVFCVASCCHSRCTINKHFYSIVSAKGTWTAPCAPSSPSSLFLPQRNKPNVRQAPNCYVLLMRHTRRMRNVRQPLAHTVRERKRERGVERGERVSSQRSATCRPDKSSCGIRRGNNGRMEPWNMSGHSFAIRIRDCANVAIRTCRCLFARFRFMCFFVFTSIKINSHDPVTSQRPPRSTCPLSRYFAVHAILFIYL